MSKIGAITAKGKLTGDEVGRLFVREYARVIKAIQEDKEPPKDMFTDAEKQGMVNQLDNNEEIGVYNTYVGINHFLQKMVMVYMSEYDQIKTLYPLLPRLIDEAKHQQAVALLNNDAPLILTQKQYDALKAKDLKEKLAQNTTLASVIFTVMQYGIQAFKDKVKDAPNLPDLEAYQKQPLTNPRFIENYWEENGNGYYVTPDGKTSREMGDVAWLREVNKWHKVEEETGQRQLKWVEDRHAPKDATKYDILEYFEHFFNLDRPTLADLETVKADYPDLYKWAITLLKGNKEFKALKFDLDKIKEADYPTTTVTHQALYDSNLPFYRGYFKTFRPNEGQFIAVIPEEQTRKASYWLDDQGNYRYKREKWERQTLTVTLPGFLAKLQTHLKSLYRIREAYKILGERLGEESITALAEEELIDSPAPDPERAKANHGENWEEWVKAMQELAPKEYIKIGLGYINSDIEMLKTMTRENSLVLDDKTVAEIREDIEALPIIELRDCKPLKENIEKAKQIGKDLKIYGSSPFLLLDTLKGIE